MAMGHMAGYADVISNKFLKNLCPKEFKAFMKELGKADNGQSEDFDAQALFDYGDYKGILKDTKHPLYKLCFLYNNLITAFKAKTKLTLTLCYHDSDSEGDRYDEVDGYYWTVGGVYQLTKAGKKYEKEITRSFFVTFG
jgi:hypothetical protein